MRAAHVAQSPVGGRAVHIQRHPAKLLRPCASIAIPLETPSHIPNRPEPHKRPYSYEDAVPSSARPCACAVLIIKRGPGKCTNNSIPFYLFLALYLLSASPGVSLSLSLSLSLPLFPELSFSPLPFVESGNRAAFDHMVALSRGVVLLSASPPPPPPSLLLMTLSGTAAILASSSRGLFQVRCPVARLK